MIKRLKESRLVCEYTQKEMAAFLNITQQTYSDYETGRTNPDIDTLTKIADVLNVTIDYLLGRADDFGNVTVQTNGVKISDDETRLLQDYRSLSPALQKMLRATIETWKESDANANSKKKTGAF